MSRKITPLKNVPAWKRSLGRTRVVRLPQNGAATAVTRGEMPRMSPIQSIVSFVPYSLILRM